LGSALPFHAFRFSKVEESFAFIRHIAPKLNAGRWFDEAFQYRSTFYKVLPVERSFSRATDCEIAGNFALTSDKPVTSESAQQS
jgi:hypothetical protein